MSYLIYVGRLIINNGVVYRIVDDEISCSNCEFEMESLCPYIKFYDSSNSYKSSSRLICQYEGLLSVYKFISDPKMNGNPLFLYMSKVIMKDTNISVVRSKMSLFEKSLFNSIMHEQQSYSSSK